MVKKSDKKHIVIVLEHWEFRLLGCAVIGFDVYIPNTKKHSPPVYGYWQPVLQ